MDLSIQKHAEKEQVSDPTFRHYSPAQAKLYADGRRHAYPDDLYDTIFQYHSQTKGEFHSLLDVGCGPGNATRDLARVFDVAVGVDPGQQMIAAAQNEANTTRTGKRVLFEVLPAEKCAQVKETKAGRELGLTERGGVDLLTSAMAVSAYL
jgi:trans-aconitate 3-methyltransferase